MQEQAGDVRTIERVKAILRNDLKLGEDAVIPDDMPLSAGDFDLDSLDMLLVVTSIEKEFGIKVSDESASRTAFATPELLAKFVDGQIAQNGSADGAVD